MVDLIFSAGSEKLLPVGNFHAINQLKNSTIMDYMIEILNTVRFGEDSNAPYNQKVTINTTLEEFENNNKALNFLATEMRFLGIKSPDIISLSDTTPLQEGENFTNWPTFIVFAMLYGFFNDDNLCTHTNTIIEIKLKQ